jgi:hypothetical protein
MRVMVSNDTSFKMGILAGATGMLGHLYSPGGERGPFEELPYVLDNGIFALTQRNVDFKPAVWIELLDWAATKEQRPLWATVPDVLFDRDRTLERWHEYVSVVRERGIRPAFVLQDGMTFADVPDADCMLFVGGSTKWKEDAIVPWCARFPGRVHVARVTERKRLWKCWRAGAVSVDGNGWWRETAKPGLEPQFNVLKEFCRAQAQERMAA